MTSHVVIWREWKNWAIKLVEKKTSIKSVQKRHGEFMGAKVIKNSRGIGIWKKMIKRHRGWGRRANENNLARKIKAYIKGASINKRVL